MTLSSIDFDEAANSLAAFKAVSQKLLTMFENDTVSYPQDEEVDPLFDQLTAHAEKSHFPSMVEDFKSLLAAANSPLDQKVAALVTRLAYQLQPTHAQIVNKLYLADISAHLPGYSPAIPPAPTIIADVQAQLNSAVATGFNNVTSTILDGLEESGDFPALPERGRYMISEFVEASVDSFLKDAEPDARAAARWLHRSFYFSELQTLDDNYPRISEKLFDHLPHAQKLEVLDSKISVVQDKAKGEPVSGLLARYGETSDDFYREDGKTLKSASDFLPSPQGAGRQVGFGNQFN